MYTELCINAEIYYLICLLFSSHLNGSIIVQSTVSESTTTHHPKDLGIRPISISSITVKEKAKTKRGLIPIDYDRSSTIDANPYLRSSMRKPQVSCLCYIIFYMILRQNLIIFVSSVKLH